MRYFRVHTADIAYITQQPRGIFTTVGKLVDANVENVDWSHLNDREKNRLLYLRQKKTLDVFLEHGAISQAQYDKSLHDLTEKMGMTEEKTRSSEK